MITDRERDHSCPSETEGIWENPFHWYYWTSLEVFTYVLDRVPPGSVDVILSYCHYSINDSTLEDLLPYLKSKGVGVISASPLAMGLLTETGPPEWHPASPELKVFW